MAIIINLDVMLAKRKVKSEDLAEYIGITEQNVSLIKTGKVRGIRLATLEAICRFLDCQPGDIGIQIPESPIGTPCCINRPGKGVRE